MSLSPRIENPVFRKFVQDTSKVEDPFVDQCKAVLHSEGMCPPPHPRWQESKSALHKSPWSESLPKVDLSPRPVEDKINESMRPALQRSNSVMNPRFFEQPIKVDGKKIEIERSRSNSTPIDESIITVAGDIIPPESDSRSEPVVEVDCRDVEKVRKKKWRWCQCLKG